MTNLNLFEKALRRENYAENTVLAYKHAARDYLTRYKSLTKDNLLCYRAELIDHYSPKTVNLRVRAVNKYLEFCGRTELKIRSIKIPKSSFLENVISQEDYLLFKSRLRKEADLRWYFIVWTLAATGARISELVRFRVEHVRAGFVDLCSKGSKVRRIYFPTRLRRELLEWAGDRERGLFVNRFGEPLTPRGIALRLKEKAVQYGIDPDLVHPHAFRHLYAKNFLQRSSDLVLLADLLGHDSVDTTRIYLQRSSREQSDLVNHLVDW